MLVWAPLTLVLHVTLYASATIALTLAPIYFFGGSAYAWGVGAIVTAILAIRLAVYLVNKMSQYRAKKRPPQKSAPKQEPTGPSFTEVLLEWCIAKKKKICPIITFTKSVAEEVRS